MSLPGAIDGMARIKDYKVTAYTLMDVFITCIS